MSFHGQSVYHWIALHHPCLPASTNGCHDRALILPYPPWRTCCRCWTHETSLLVNQTIDDDLPYTQFHEYFAPDYSINVVPSKEVERDNQNKKEASCVLKGSAAELWLSYLRILQHGDGHNTKHDVLSVAQQAADLNQG